MRAPACLAQRVGRALPYRLADELRARGLPFLFTTGYDRSAFPALYAGAPRPEKPVEAEEVVRALDLA